jgi:hypothetical protein
MNLVTVSAKSVHVKFHDSKESFARPNWEDLFQPRWSWIDNCDISKLVDKVKREVPEEGGYWTTPIVVLVREDGLGEDVFEEVGRLESYLKTLRHQKRWYEVSFECSNYSDGDTLYLRPLSVGQIECLDAIRTSQGL